jgi:signal transduction histidine kinase
MSQAANEPVRLEHGGRAAASDLADLTNVVLHEINNALNSIALNLAVMEQKGAPRHLETELNAIRREVAAVGTKARRLQEICQVGQPALELVDLNRTADQVVEAWRRQHAESDIDLAIAPHLPRIRATQCDLERLLGLLIQDATASANGGRVTVSTSDAGGEIELRVADTGPPLSREAEARLFEPFARGRAGDENVRLSLCRALAKRLQGHIRAENRPEGGVAVIVRLQAAK